MEPVKIKISQSRYNHLEIAGMPKQVLDKYFEVDPTKKNDDFYDTNVKTPFDGEVIK